MAAQTASAPSKPATVGRCVLRYLRMSPRKVRYVIDPLRHRTVAFALEALAVTNRRACKPISKAIAAAFANARQQDPALAEDRVVISRVFCDGGPTWKRHRAAAFGRAVMIMKRTSHITIELERVAGPARPTKTPPAAAAAAAPAKKPAGRKRLAAGKKTS